jgi:hypothetical protein
MDDVALTGPLEQRLGRWLLDRLVATAVRYGHPFAVVLARSAEPAATAERLAAVLRGADVVVDWGRDELLVLLPDTAADGARTALARLGEAAPEAALTAVAWEGDLAEDLLGRLARGQGAVPAPASGSRSLS